MMPDPRNFHCIFRLGHDDVMMIWSGNLGVCDVGECLDDGMTSSFPVTRNANTQQNFTLDQWILVWKVTPLDSGNLGVPYSNCGPWPNGNAAVATSVEGIGCSNLLASFSSTSLGGNWAASCSKRNPHLLEVQFSCTWSALQFLPSSCWVLAGGDLVPEGMVSVSMGLRITSRMQSWLIRQVGRDESEVLLETLLGLTDLANYQLSSVLKVLQNYLTQTILDPRKHIWIQRRCLVITLLCSKGHLHRDQRFERLCSSEGHVV